MFRTLYHDKVQTTLNWKVLQNWSIQEMKIITETFGISEANKGFRQ
jgi:hypothetical protein